MGLDVDSIILCQPDNGEMALEVVDQLVRSSAVDIIAIDSVAALVPRAEIEGEIGAVQGARCWALLHACLMLVLLERMMVRVAFVLHALLTQQYWSILSG